MSAGPWAIIEHSWSDTSIVGPEGTIVTLSIYDEATEDNQAELEIRQAKRAHLIAAAPTMLTAIEQFEAWWQEVGQVSFNGAPACVFALREAAAKARGGA